MAAEYVVAHGNPQVALCERGIRTFETATRNTLDLNAVPVLKALTHLPVVVDPSHGIGIRAHVPAMARAGIAAGADAIIVEVHPSRARSAPAAASNRRAENGASSTGGGSPSTQAAMASAVMGQSRMPLRVWPVA